jgi:hypothetical protein
MRKIYFILFMLISSLICFTSCGTDDKNKVMRKTAISERNNAVRVNHSSSIKDDPNAEVCNAIKNLAVYVLDLQNFCSVNDDT